jgi:hypothetical protein
MPIVVQPLLDTVVGNGAACLFLFAAAGQVFVIGERGAAVDARVGSPEGAGRSSPSAQPAAARQTVTEGLVLGGLSALCASSSPRCSGHCQMARQAMSSIEDASLDLRVLGFCAVAVLVWVLALGTVPSGVIASSNPARNRAPAVIPESGTRGLRVRDREIAAAVVVAIGPACWCGRSSLPIDRGFDSSNLTVIRSAPGRYADAHRLAFYDELLPVASIPA